MIAYSNFELDNGLQVFVHEDTSNPMAVVNIIYNVGSRDEEIHKTGFAHLFEHLMFGGSQNIATFDTPLQKVGGENNAFTSPDVTNYYITLPAANIETAFWLESDRMKSLSFDPKVLEVQRKVVIEEFKQRYLNQPYGDVWLKIRPLVYETHPYQWATIGKDISHIENATMDDVKSFFQKFYNPTNAILVVGGNVKLEQIKKLALKWFGDIKKGEKITRNLPKEISLNKKKTLNVTSNVPSNAIYKAYLMGKRLDTDFYAHDLLSDILGRGQSSRLYQKLVREKKLFSAISAYCLGSIDEGIFMIEGKLNKDVSFEKAEKAIDEEVYNITLDNIENELAKVKNQAETYLEMAETELLNRCMNVAFAANMGDASIVNKESKLINQVTVDDIKKAVSKTLRDSNASVLYYHSSQN